MEIVTEFSQNSKKHNWVKEIKEERDRKRDHLIYRLSRLGWTQEEISGVVCVHQTVVGDVLNKGFIVFDKTLKDLLSKGYSIDEIGRKLGCDDQAQRSPCRISIRFTQSITRYSYGRFLSQIHVEGVYHPIVDGCNDTLQVRHIALAQFEFLAIEFQDEPDIPFILVSCDDLVLNFCHKTTLCVQCLKNLLCLLTTWLSTSGTKYSRIKN